MNINPMMLVSMVQNMIGNNAPQAVAQKILKDNPQFANMIRGQNPQQMAMGGLKQMGINPEMFENMQSQSARK